MFRRFFIHFTLILGIVSASWAGLSLSGRSHVAVPSPVYEQQPRGSILLVPLDSRPPCTDYVDSLARMAGYRIILPPGTLLDDYRRPGDASGLRHWLQENIAAADSAVISVDMLVHGGLLASRKGRGGDADADATLSLLAEIHRAHPGKRLFAFNIIPRLLISDDPATEKFKQPMAEWSMLQETASLFENPRESGRLRDLEASIPAEIIARYRKLYADNSVLNRRLAGLVRDGTLAGLVIGQDDSAPFGLGNMERQRLDREAESRTDGQERIFVTRGTDEVALTMLGLVLRSHEHERLKVFVHYTESHTADAVLPYMPRPLSRTVAEKLAIAGMEEVRSADEADYVLVVHAGTARSGQKTLAAEAGRVRGWLEGGRNVALVDLAVDWRADETLLPSLYRNGTPIHRLLAYAGWNTASNSVGTAVTQAAAVLSGRRAAEGSRISIQETARAQFLAERILDDWYYQKDFRPQLNEKLQRQGTDPYALLLARPAAEGLIRHKLHNAYLQYIRWGWRDAVFPLPADPARTFSVAGWEVISGLPWDRTFEVYVRMQLAPASVIH